MRKIIHPNRIVEWSRWSPIRRQGLMVQTFNSSIDDYTTISAATHELLDWILARPRLERRARWDVRMREMLVHRREMLANKPADDSNSENENEVNSE